MNNLALFDLKNLSDLDSAVICELKSHKQSEPDSQILSLFKIKRDLTVDEIIVGLARRYRLKKPRHWVVSRLYILAQRGFIHRIRGKKGLYSTVP